MKEVSEKITERIRKLIRLKESATQIGSEGEAHAAAAAVHRLLMEYNLSLLDLAGENPQNRLTACESDRISYKDAAKLKKYVSERGKILPRRVTGTCAKHQRAVTVAVKRARHMAIMPYVDD